MRLDDWLAQRRAARAAAGLTRAIHPRAPTSALIDLAGNDYLGLGLHPLVTEAAADAARTWGAGAGASRLVTGSLAVHRELEDALAGFCGRPAALLFSTGYHANLGVVAALADADTLIVSDAHVHASLVDACRLAHHGGLVITPHNDTEAVAMALRDRDQPRAIVLVESVYSVLGDAAPLAALAEVTRTHDATLLVDEAHAIGVSGPGGRGLVAAAELGGADHVVVTLTLSKALASQGGAVLASRAIIEHVVNTARPFIYDTGLAPPATAAAHAALKVISADPGLPRRAVTLAREMASTLDLPAPAGSVLSIPMAAPEAALQAQADFASDGFAVGCFRPPSVPDAVSRLRLTAKASLTDSQVAQVLTRLSQVVGQP